MRVAGDLVSSVDRRRASETDALTIGGIASCVDYSLIVTPEGLDATLRFCQAGLRHSFGDAQYTTFQPDSQPAPPDGISPGLGTRYLG
jgi:hypothetical protein